jgi:hypothetical protein
MGVVEAAAGADTEFSFPKQHAKAKIYFNNKYQN